MCFTDFVALGCTSQTVCLQKMHAQSWGMGGGGAHLNWSSFDTVWSILVSWSSSSLSELEKSEDDDDELGDLHLHFFLLCFLLHFFLCLGGERDWEEDDVRLVRFPCLSFLLKVVSFWIRISLDSSLLYFWALRATLLILLTASFAWYIFEINPCHFFNFHSVRALKVERGG